MTTKSFILKKKENMGHAEGRKIKKSSFSAKKRALAEANSAATTAPMTTVPLTTTPVTTVPLTTAPMKNGCLAVSLCQIPPHPPKKPKQILFLAIGSLLTQDHTCLISKTDLKKIILAPGRGAFCLGHRAVSVRH